MPATHKKKPYTAKDMREVSDNPKWTEEDFKKAKRFTDVFPDLAASIRRGRGLNKAATKKLVSLRLSPEVIDHFKATGPGWQSKIDDVLRQAAKKKLPAKKAAPKRKAG